MIRKSLPLVVVAFLLMSCALLTPSVSEEELKATVMVEVRPTIEAEIARSVEQTVNAVQPTADTSYSGGTSYNITDPFSATLVQIAGPMEGSLEATDPDKVPGWCALVDVTDFMVEATFSNPYGISSTEWSYGFYLRDEGSNDQIRVVIHNGYWYVYQGAGDYLHKASATYYQDSGMPNWMQVYVQGTMAYLYINGVLQGDFNIGNYTMASGDVCVIAWIYDGDPLNIPVPYEDFYVWEAR